MAKVRASSVGAMSLRTFFPLALSALALVACSSSSSSGGPNDMQFGDPATCQFTQNKNNCLDQMFATIDACLATNATTPTGTLTADGASCASTDGHVHVTFDPALPSLDAEPKGYDATIANSSGATCAHFVKNANDNGYTITDGSGKTATLVYTAPHQVKFTCPDGSGWQDNDQDLCLVVLPGETATSYGSSGIQVSLLGLNHALFRCVPHN